MNYPIVELFKDKEIVDKIKRRLPYMFQLAEMESSRSRKTAMEVGSIREKIIIALFIYKFGEANVDVEIPVIESQIDVRVFGRPISIKTITGKELSGVKLVWTVDPKKVEDFYKNYYPSSDLLLVQVNWGSIGGLYYIPLEVQERIFRDLSKEAYIKLPKLGTNPRGVEISKEALFKLINDENTCIILKSGKKVI